LCAVADVAAAAGGGGGVAAAAPLSCAFVAAPEISSISSVSSLLISMYSTTGRSGASYILPFHCTCPANGDH